MAVVLVLPEPDQHSTVETLLLSASSSQIRPRVDEDLSTRPVADGVYIK